MIIRTPCGPYACLQVYGQAPELCCGVSAYPATGMKQPMPQAIVVSFDLAGEVPYVYTKGLIQYQLNHAASHKLSHSQTANQLSDKVAHSRQRTIHTC